LTLIFWPVGIYFFSCRAYDSTKLYRDLKLRGALIQNKQLKLLPLVQKITNLQYCLRWCGDSILSNCICC